MRARTAWLHSSSVKLIGKWDATSDMILQYDLSGVITLKCTSRRVQANPNQATFNKIYAWLNFSWVILIRNTMNFCKDLLLILAPTSQTSQTEQASLEQHTSDWKTECVESGPEIPPVKVFTCSCCCRAIHTRRRGKKERKTDRQTEEPGKEMYLKPTDKHRKISDQDLKSFGRKNVGADIVHKQWLFLQRQWQCFNWVANRHTHTTLLLQGKGFLRP